MVNKDLIHKLTERELDDEVKLSVRIVTRDPSGDEYTLCVVDADIESVSVGGWPVIIKAEGEVELSLTHKK